MDALGSLQAGGLLELRARQNDSSEACYRIGSKRAYDCCFEACSPPHIHLSAKYCEDMHSE